MVLGIRLRDIFLNKLGLMVAATLLVAGCSGGGGGEGAAGGITNAVTLNSISITPTSATVTKGLNTSFTATGTFGDGSTVDITNTVTWNSSYSGIAQIDSATGVASGLNTGTSTITASANGVTSNGAILSVSAATLVSISISPTTPSTPLGAPVFFTATGTYTDGSTGNVSGSVTWTSSNTTVATLNGSGIASTLTQGTTTITAVASGLTSNSVTLTVTAPVMSVITINPATATVAAGLNTSFTATGSYTDGSTVDITSQVAWSTANTGIATIAAGGTATGKAVGSTTVIAALNGITSGSASLTVTNALITGISISPTAPATPLGAPFTFTATGTFTDGSTGDVSGSVAWTSSNTSVATLSASGIAASLSQGTTTVTASANGVTSNSATLTVTPPILAAITVNRTTATVAAGLNTSFTASGRYTDGSTADLTSQVSWTSANTGVATMASGGVATGVTVGSTTVTAALNGINSSSVSLIVTNALITSISVTPTAPSTQLGLPVTFTAIGTYTDGSTGDASGSVNWISNNTAVATVNNLGIASSLAQGTTTVTASANGVTSNSAILTVTAPALTTISLTPASTSMLTGSTQQFTAIGSYLNGSTADITGLVTWASSNTAVATTSGAGLVSGLSVGTGNITASLGGVTGTAALKVLSQLGGALQGIPLALSAAVTTFAGSGTAGFADGTGTAASFNSSYSITTDGTSLYVAECANRKIRKIDIATGAVTTLAGSGAIGSADGTGTAASFGCLLGITTDGTRVFVTDGDYQNIRQIDIATGVVTTMATVDSTGTPVSFSTNWGITTDGLRLYVGAMDYIYQIDIATRVVTKLYTLFGHTFQGITTDGTSLYVVNTFLRKIFRIDIATGALVGAWGNPIYVPADITTDGTSLYVTDWSQIFQINIATGTVNGLAAGSKAFGITTDGTSLFVTDNSNFTIRQIK